MNRCRVCKNYLSGSDGIIFPNMPSAANAFQKNVNKAKASKLSLHLVKCKKCSVVQLTNRLVKNYKKVVRSSFISGEFREFRLKQLRNFLKRYNLKEKKVLEIGCFEGEFVKLFNKEISFSFFGCEFSKQINYNKRVFECYLGDSPLKASDKFAGFYSFNVFEHWPHWKKIIKNLRINLEDEAYGIIEVPNANYIISKGLYNEIIGDHIYYFTLPSFAKALELAGFEVLAINTILENYVLTAEVRLPSRILFKKFTEKEKKLKIELSRFLSSSGFPIVVWGAGHQSLATMSSVGKKAKKIKYVVDSSPLKIGSFTPGSGCLIKSPEILKSEKLPLRILIICGSFNQEIVKIIKSWKKNKNIIYALNDGSIEEII